MESVLTSKNNYEMVFINSIVACTLMLSNLYGAECPKYEDMIIIQKSKTVKTTISLFSRDVKEIKIITQSNPYFSKIMSHLQGKYYSGVKALRNKNWKYEDGITFCFAGHPEKSIKIRNLTPEAENYYVYRYNGGTYRIHMKKEETSIFYKLINLSLEQKPTKKNQEQQETKAK